MEDPILIKRAKISRLVSLGMRAGYGLYGLCVLLFIIGLMRPGGFNGNQLPAAIVATLVIGSAFLAPAIVFSYAVKAADKADRNDDWD